MIVTKTNRYAAECLSASHDGNGPPPTWETNAKALFEFSVSMSSKAHTITCHFRRISITFPLLPEFHESDFLEIQCYVDISSLAQCGNPNYDRLATCHWYSE